MSTDPRIPIDVPADAFSPSAWRKGYAACLADLDSGLFDNPLPAEIDAAADYGFKVEKVDCGCGPTGDWMVTYEGEQYGPVFGTRREAQREAVARHKEDIRYA
jgi:hypothetical protein